MPKCSVYNALMRTGVSAWRVLLKGVLLFFMLEYALVWLLPAAGPTNVYAALNMKRQRFPLSTASPVDDAQDVGNLDAMFAAHVVSNPKAPDEFRVIVLGDSAVWGLQLEPAQTLPAELDSLGLSCDDKRIRVYNLSFPRSSATKDLMILDKALAYHPDLILWSLTWYTLMPKTRVDHWLVTQNPQEFYDLGRRFGFLPRGWSAPTALEGAAARNAALFHQIRFQAYSAVELATGLEQIPGPPEKLPGSLSADVTFEGLKPPTLRQGQVSLDQVSDFHKLARSVPVVLVNETLAKTFFAGRSAMDIEGFGIRQAELFAHLGYIKSLADVYYLDSKVLLELEGYGERRVQNLARSLLNYGDYWAGKKENLESAEAMADLATRLVPGDASYIRQAATVLMKAGDEAKALDIFGPAWLDKGGAALTDADLYTYANFWSRQSKNLESARTAAQRMTVLQPKVYFYWSVLGSICEKLGDKAGAIAALEKALELAPANAKMLIKTKLDGLKKAP